MFPSNAFETHQVEGFNKYKRNITARVCIGSVSWRFEDDKPSPLYKKGRQWRSTFNFMSDIGHTHTVLKSIDSGKTCLCNRIANKNIVKMLYG